MQRNLIQQIQEPCVCRPAWQSSIEDRACCCSNGPFRQAVKGIARNKPHPPRHLALIFLPAPPSVEPHLHFFSLGCKHVANLRACLRQTVELSLRIECPGSNLNGGPIASARRTGWPQAPPTPRSHRLVAIGVLCNSGIKSQSLDDDA